MDLALNTERLALRRLGAGDAARLAALADNWNIAANLGRMPYPYELSDAEAFLASVAGKLDEEVFAVTRAGGLIGCIGLDLRRDRAELGYWLGEAYWGQGYATEAARAVIRHGFVTHGLPHIRAGHFIDNAASARVLSKVGFRYTGAGRRACRARGGMVESREMILERTDWERA